MGYLLAIIMISSASAFCIQLMRKWGMIEWVQVHGNLFFAEMFSCNLCLSWWINVALCLFATIISANPLLLILPFVNTPLTQKLL